MLLLIILVMYLVFLDFIILLIFFIPFSNPLSTTSLSWPLILFILLLIRWLSYFIHQPFDLLQNLTTVTLYYKWVPFYAATLILLAVFESTWCIWASVLLGCSLFASGLSRNKFLVVCIIQQDMIGCIFQRELQPPRVVLLILLGCFII